MWGSLDNRKMLYKAMRIVDLGGSALLILVSSVGLLIMRILG